MAAFDREANEKTGKGKHVALHILTIKNMYMPNLVISCRKGEFGHPFSCRFVLCYNISNCSPKTEDQKPPNFLSSDICSSKISPFVPIPKN